MGRPKLDRPNYRLEARAGIYHVVWHEGRTRSISTRTGDAESARQWRDQWIAGRARPLPPAQPTISAIVDGYTADKQQAAALRRLKQCAVHIKAAFGRLEPQHLSKALCRSYASGRKFKGRKVTPSTVRRELAVLRSALLWAKEEGWIASAPELELPPQNAPRDRWLTREEAAKLIDAAGITPHLQLFILIALHTGSRTKAILDLTWDRVNFDAKLIDFTKPGKKRTSKRQTTVPINRTLLSALKAAEKIRTSDYVVEYDAGPVGSIKKSFARAVRRAKLVKVTPHTLRHTAATWLAIAGRPMDEIARMLGITLATAERHYAKWSPDYLREAAAALE